MPKVAILSDIHANLEALNTVLEKCREIDPGMEFVCLGDIVGYNANPHECLEIVRNLDCKGLVKGNHDEYVSSESGVEGFNANAKRAIEWTKGQLTEDELTFLGKLPAFKSLFSGYNAVLVHATLDSPLQWGYILDLHHAISCFESKPKAMVSFCGHSHVPIAFCKNAYSSSEATAYETIVEWIPTVGEGSFEREESCSIKLRSECRYLFNVGSIGQPRNRDPRASFAVYDTDHKIVTRYLLPYDYTVTQARILEAGLPERLAVRLALGM